MVLRRGALTLVLVCSLGGCELIANFHEPVTDAGEGEACLDSRNCRDGLSCIEGRCRGSASDGDGESDADTERDIDIDIEEDSGGDADSDGDLDNDPDTEGDAEADVDLDTPLDADPETDEDPEVASDMETAIDADDDFDEESDADEVRSECSSGEIQCSGTFLQECRNFSKSPGNVAREPPLSGRKGERHG